MQKKILLVSLAAVAVALATASVAWACTTYIGQTYVNGSPTPGDVSAGTPFEITADGVPSGPLGSGGLGYPAEGTKWLGVAADKGACCSNVKKLFSPKMELRRIDGIAPDKRDFVNANDTTKRFINGGINERGAYSICLLFTTEQDEIDKALNTSIPRPDKNMMGSSGNWATTPANLNIVN